VAGRSSYWLGTTAVVRGHHKKHEPAVLQTIKLVCYYYYTGWLAGGNFRFCPYKDKIGVSQVGQKLLLYAYYIL
jgi:hypothetical protein